MIVVVLLALMLPPLVAVIYKQISRLRLERNVQRVAVRRRGRGGEMRARLSSVGVWVGIAAIMIFLFAPAIVVALYSFNKSSADGLAAGSGDLELVRQGVRQRQR